MKQAIHILIILMLCSQQTRAQKDTMVIQTTTSAKPDTIYIKMVKAGKVKDTFIINEKISYAGKDSLVIRKGTDYILRDRGHTYRQKDSAARQYAYTGYSRDSINKIKQQVKFLQQDRAFKKSDSLYRLTGKRFARMDSLHRINSKLQQRSFDSLRSVKWRSDSMRIKTKLNRLKSDLQRIKQDSLIQNNRLDKKEVSMEVNCSRNGNVVIRNLSRKITVKTFNENKVRIVTIVRAEAGAETKDIDWVNTLNVDIEQNKNEVVIKPADTRSVTVTSSSSGNGSVSMSYAHGATINEGNVGDSRIYNADKKSDLLIYIPTNAKLDVESRYNNVTILNDLSNLSINLKSASLIMENAGTAVINSSYGTVSSGDLKNADITLMNSKLLSGDIDKLIIDSKYSTVTFKNSNVIEMKSISDQYSIAQVGKITVSKNFGKFNIALLNNSIDMTGSSADLNVSAIKSSATEIKINNKYADLKLPLALLTNYSLQFDGNYSKVFTPFENIRNAADSFRSPNVNFTRTIGNIHKNFTAFNVSCTSCAVDFR